MIAALAIGVVLAVGALCYVLYPVFFAPAVQRVHPVLAPRETEQQLAVAALREIEFDRATGKLSDADYTELKARYTQQAIIAMRREAPVAGAAGQLSDDDIEAAVRAYREQHAACPSCGPRPEPDAVFCSNCGRYLREKCAGCGARVEAPDARFCVSCGNRLAA